MRPTVFVALDDVPDLGILRGDRVALYLAPDESVVLHRTLDELIAIQRTLPPNFGRILGLWVQGILEPVNPIRALVSFAHEPLEPAALPAPPPQSLRSAAASRPRWLRREK